MKKAFIFLLTSILYSALAFAQTPMEIVSRMEEEMDKHENDGVVMNVDLKIPILGTVSSKTYAIGEKARIEAEMMGVTIVTWTDGVTDWTYDSKSNEIEIKKSGSSSSNEGDTEMFSNVTEGYDITLTKETADAWYFQCKKSKKNTNKDDPKTMDLVIAKGTYQPVSLSTKLKGVTVTLRNLYFKVTEKEVTFNPADYPGVSIVDERK